MRTNRSRLRLGARLLPLALAATLLAPAGAHAAPAPAEGTAKASPGEGAAPSASSSAKRRASRRKRARLRRDLDGDGIPNWRDSDLDGDGIWNKRDRNIDGDRRRNARDPDIDGDRRRNGRDREMDADRIRNSRDRDIDADRLRNCPRDRDMDADGVPNSRDGDMDADGVPNGRDRDMDSDGRPNPLDSDMDCDRIPNRFDPDVDGDGIPNEVDPDSDADGIAAETTLPTGVRLPKSFFGIVAVHAWASEGAVRDVQLTQVAATGVRTLRHVFEWADLEPLPGIYKFDAYDAYVGDAARHGFTVQPILFNPPAFRSSRPVTGAARGVYPPRSNAEFGAFAARVVDRYGPGGSFWAEHPEIPRRPVTTWQVWNEPHLSFYWPTGPDPAGYTAMLKAVSAAIKGADPSAEVLPAPLSPSNLGIPIKEFIQGMYDAGAASAFDTLAVNPYAQAADQVLELMLELRALADRNGDGGTPMRVTELGWATGGPESPFKVTHDAQADLIKVTWGTLVRHRAQLGLKGLVYYSWRDLAPYVAPFQDYFGLHTGLLERDGRPKPGLFSFGQTVHALTAP